MADPMTNLLEDLHDEYARLESLLEGLTDDQWLSASGAPGWSVRDVMVHLADTEEGVAATLGRTDERWADRELSVDDFVAARVAENDEAASVVFARWKQAATASINSLRTAEPDARFAWAAAPLRPMTLATTRLAEHWAHGLDIAEPLGLEFADTGRLRHIAWLGHATLPYACEIAGFEAQPLRAELIGPSGDTWTFGPPDAADVVHGDAGVFCRVGARRIAAADSGLETRGDFAPRALEVLRNYAA